MDYNGLLWTQMKQHLFYARACVFPKPSIKFQILYIAIANLRFTFVLWNLLFCFFLFILQFFLSLFSFLEYHALRALIPTTLKPTKLTYYAYYGGEVVWCCGEEGV